MNRNKKLIQYQPPGRGQGDFYRTKEVNPDHLGINPKGEVHNLITGNKEKLKKALTPTMLKRRSVY
ncbi:MAG: polymorphic toxin type 46 domain-containing protein [Neisseriaceae bacterium]